MSTIIDTLIFDRTSSDLEVAQTCIRNNTPLPSNNLKFSWDYRALNRTEQAMKYLQDKLTELGYFTNMTFKYDWTNEPITADHAYRYIENLKTIRNYFVMRSDVPVVPNTINGMSISKANDIERILACVDTEIKNIEKDLIYSGVGNSGQSRIWQRRFRVIIKYMKWSDLTYTYWSDIPNNTKWGDIYYVD